MKVQEIRSAPKRRAKVIKGASKPTSGSVRSMRRNIMRLRAGN